MAKINLTSVHELINNIKTELFYEDDVTLKLFNTKNEFLLELESGFYIQKEPTSNLATGAEYFECSIVDNQEDEINLDKILDMTQRVEFGNDKYSKLTHFRPRGLTRRWIVRLTSFGTKTPIAKT